MNLFHFKKKCRLALSAFGLVLSSAAIAQSTSVAPSAKPQAASPSAFDGYKPYAEEPMTNWKAANDSVAQIGGWREYAKQTQQPDNMPGVAGNSFEATPKPDTPPTTKAKP